MHAGAVRSPGTSSHSHTHWPPPFSHSSLRALLFPSRHFPTHALRNVILHDASKCDPLPHVQKKKKKHIHGSNTYRKCRFKPHSTRFAGLPTTFGILMCSETLVGQYRMKSFRNLLDHQGKLINIPEKTITQDTSQEMATNPRIHFGPQFPWVYNIRSLLEILSSLYLHGMAFFWLSLLSNFSYTVSLCEYCFSTQPHNVTVPQYSIPLVLFTLDTYTETNVYL